MKISRRHAVAIAFPFVTAGIMIAACSFPDVTFSTESGGGREGGTDTGGGRDVTLEVTSRTEDTQRVDGGCDAKPACDCDEDGYRAEQCEGGDPSLKPGDCDDLDRLRHPDQVFVDSVPEGHNGDWNCDGKVERVPDKLACEDGIACSFDTNGYLTNVGCGGESDTYNCNGVLLQCSPSLAETKVKQNCR